MFLETFTHNKNFSVGALYILQITTNLSDFFIWESCFLKEAVDVACHDVVVLYLGKCH